MLFVSYYVLAGTENIQIQIYAREMCLKYEQQHNRFS